MVSVIGLIKERRDGICLEKISPENINNTAVWFVNKIPLRRACTFGLAAA